MDMTKKSAFGPLVVPMPHEAYRRSIGKFETGYINRVGGRMLTAHTLPHRISNNVATIIGAKILNGRDPAVEHFLCRRLNGVENPQIECRRGFTRQLSDADAGATYF